MSITILIPVYNGEKYIAECVESVLSQRFKDFKVLISDNCSTDGTLKVIERFSDPRITVIPQPKNLGAYGNLNVLYSAFDTELAHILCADDYYSSQDSLKTIYQFASSHPGAALCAFDNQTKHAERSHWKALFQISPSGSIDSRIAMIAAFCFGCFVGGLSNIVLRKSLIAHHLNFNPDSGYNGDGDFYSRLFQSGGAVALSREQVTFRRHHEASISRSFDNSQKILKEKSKLNNFCARMMLTSGFPKNLVAKHHRHIAYQNFHFAYLQVLKRHSLRPLASLLEIERANWGSLGTVYTMLASFIWWPKPIQRIYDDQRTFQALVKIFRSSVSSPPIPDSDS